MESSGSSDGGGRGQGSGGLGGSTCSVPPGRGGLGGARGAAAPPCLTGRACRIFQRPPRSGKGVQLRGLCWQLLEFQAGLGQEHPCPRDALERSRRPKALAAAMLPWHDGLFSAWVAFCADLPLLTPCYPGEGILWCVWHVFF